MAISNSISRRSRRGAVGLKKAFSNKYVLIGSATTVGLIGAVVVIRRRAGPVDPPVPTVATPELQSVRWNRSATVPTAVDIRFRVYNAGSPSGQFTAGFADQNGDVLGWIREVVGGQETLILEIIGAYPWTTSTHTGFVGEGIVADTDPNISTLDKIDTMEFSITPPDLSGGEPGPDPAV